MRPLPGQAASARRNPLARFCAAGDGATAVEFALVAPIFLAVFIAIIQIGIFLFSQQTLQTAATAAGRMFMTGQAQNSKMTRAQFLNAICPKVSPLFNCNKLMVDVQAYSSFAGANASAPTLTYDAHGNVTNTWSYNPGTPGQVMVVRLIYQQSVVSAPLGFSLGKLANGEAEMMGVSAFRVEPY